MRVFKNAWFTKYAEKERISNATLVNAIQELESGNINASLGGGVIKQRIARQGQGKSSGYRTIIYYRQGERAFFVYAFAKNQRDNISAIELKGYKQMARQMLSLNDDAIEKAIEIERLIEIEVENDNV